MVEHSQQTTFKPNKRAINGILLIDKPVGLSSNQVLQKIKRLYDAEKAGHTGSLDPLASGMLPICFGEATKFSQHLLNASKRYQAMVRLGITTTTGDAEGEIIKKNDIPVLTPELLEKIRQQFMGIIEQLPPMFSALKHQGQPLYKLARKGISIERKPRQVHIYSLSLQQISLDTISIAVHCSKGTYIRSLAEDIGEAIGCGAYILELRRSWVEPYQKQPLYTLDELQNQYNPINLQVLDSKLLPIDSAIGHLPIVEIDDLSLRKIQQGQIVPLHQQVTKLGNNDLVRCYHKHCFAGLGHLSNGLLKAERLLKCSG